MEKSLDKIKARVAELKEDEGGPTADDAHPTSSTTPASNDQKEKAKTEDKSTEEVGFLRPGVAVEELSVQEMQKAVEAVKFYQMNVCSLSFKSESVDVVLEKGTMDCVSLSSNKERDRECDEMCKEIFRVLRPGGTMVMVSVHGPEERLPFLKPLQEPERYGWKVAYKAIPFSPPESPMDKVVHCYIVTKSLALSDDAQIK